MFQSPATRASTANIVQDTPATDDSAKRKLFDESPAIQVKPLSKRKKKFNVKTPTKTSEPTTNTVRVIKVVPRGVENALTGLIIIPTGSFMDKHLHNAMRLKADDPINTCFINSTNAAHWTFPVKDASGHEIAKQGSDGKLYNYRSCFISLEAEDFDTDDKVRDIINNSFGPALWKFHR